MYLREAYNEFVAFLYGWTSILVIRTGIIAAVSFVFAEYTSSLLGLGRTFVKPIAISVIFFLSFLNIRLQTGKSILNVSVFAKVSALIAIVIFGLLSKKGNMENLYVSYNIKSSEILYKFGLLLVPVLWTYGGWHENTYMTEETKDAQKVLPIALTVSTLFITTIYVLLNVIYLYIIPAKEMVKADLIAGDVMNRIFGELGRKWIDALIVVSSFGTLNATIMTSSRITYAMSIDNPLFRYFSHISERFRTPVRAILINAVWSSILVIWGTFSKLLFFTGFLVWLFFAAIVSGIFLLRIRRPDMERPFQVWGYPITPAIFVSVCLWICINIFLKYPEQSTLGALIMLSGIPVYLFTKRKNLLFLFLPLALALNFSSLRKQMVEEQIIARGIRDKRVINAMLKVPRHLFVPEKYRREAYNDYPLPIGYGQTISQPYIVALMTEELRLKKQIRYWRLGQDPVIRQLYLLRLQRRCIPLK